MRKMVRAGAGIFYKQEPEPGPHKKGPAPQHWISYVNFVGYTLNFFSKYLSC
jgi:hypothetical protein